MATREAAAVPAAQRHLMNRAALVGLLMRHTVNLGVALIALADPAGLAMPAGRWLLAVLMAWSVFRLATRSHGARWLAVDYGLVLAVCVAIPVLTPAAEFYASNTAPQAIAGTAVVSFAVSVSWPISVLMTAGIAAAYAFGAAGVIGWDNLTSVGALFYFAVQCATASIIRYMLLRAASVIDRARSEREEAEVAQRVTDALRDYEREQLALLHDTAASTLMMVGQGGTLPARRLAAQARRDLKLLRDGAWEAPPPRMDLVAALRECAEHLVTPVMFDGRDRLWLPGATAGPVVAAAREAMNNVDRHAEASLLRITVTDDMVRVHDDGVGFDVDAPRRGHGVDESVIGRMTRARGQARVMSSPGAGTVTELSWAPAEPAVKSPTVDPDRLVERTRTRYGLALTAYALVNLGVTVPPDDAALGIVAAAGSLAAVPGILWQRWIFAWPAGALLLGVAVAQPMLLPADALIGQAHWAQSGIGWCLLPLLLALPTRTGAALLVGVWVLNSSVAVLRDPSAAMLVNVGLGTASILTVQLFAFVFNGLMRDAARVLAAETRAHRRLLTRDRVSAALRSEYQRRYAAIVESVVPLLATLTRGDPVDAATQARARAECRRLRTLFEQAATFDHPLMQRIRPLVDRAESDGLDVTLDVSGVLPALDDGQITALTDSLAAVLARAATSVRIVATGLDDQVEISVVIDTDTDTAPTGAGNAEVVVSGRELWCLIRSSASR
ncbi:sensor histidine kinase [Mycolicibacterium vaccae]|uniref:sensor histidine kinase n=1 Tax=Mycolicibacterium vaccae TaxID=1810 RepID=UPI003CFC7BDD